MESGLFFSSAWVRVGWTATYLLKDCGFQGLGYVFILHILEEECCF